MMSISFEQAKVALSSNGQTVEDLFLLVKSVTGRVEGATDQSTYLLYSGKMADGAYASDVARTVKLAEGVVEVTQSDVGKLLNSNEFNRALGRAIRLEVLGDAFAVPSTPEQVDGSKGQSS